MRSFLDLHQPAVRRAAATTRHRLRHDRRGRVRRRVHHLGAGVLVLTLAGEGDREHLTAGVLAEHVDGRVLHRDLGADVAVDPLHPGALLAGGPLGHQVVDVVRPVLDGRVTAAGVLLHDDFDDRAVQRVGRVDRRGAALDVVHVRALVDDDQRPLELAHVLGVDPEVGLQRDLDLHALGHVDERPAGPHRAVFSAANLLSPTGITEPKYSWKISGCSRSAVSVSRKMTPCSSRSSRILW